MLGLPFRRDLNTDEKLSAFLGQIFKQNPLTPVVIYFNGAEFISRAAGEKPPEGYTVFEGVYSDFIYYSFISKGLYPIGDIRSEVRYFGFDIPETTARHGLSHLGGFFENKEYAGKIQDLGRYYLTLNERSKETRVRAKVAFFSESLWFPSAEQTQAIDSFLNSIRSTVSRQDLTTFESANTRISQMDESSLITFARQVLDTIPESTPLGGGSRDYTEKLSFLKQIRQADLAKHETRRQKINQANVRNQAQQGYDLLTSMSIRESVMHYDLARALSNKDIDGIKTNLAKLLVHAHGMISFEIKDWYAVATYETTESSQRLLEHLCRSGIYNPKLSLYKTFCL